MHPIAGSTGCRIRATSNDWWIAIHQKGGGMAARMQKITPFLWFDDKAEEAMNFYDWS